MEMWAAADPGLSATARPLPEAAEVLVQSTQFHIWPLTAQTCTGAEGSHRARAAPGNNGNCALVQLQPSSSRVPRIHWSLPALKHPPSQQNFAEEHISRGHVLCEQPCEPIPHQLRPAHSTQTSTMVSECSRTHSHAALSEGLRPQTQRTHHFSLGLHRSSSLTSVPRVSI